MIRLLVALIVVAAALAAVWHRAEYKSWPWDPPVWLTYCERTYARGPVERPEPAAEAAGGELREAFRAPPVVGRHVLVDAGHRCGETVPTLIHRDAGGGKVISYALLGGP